MNGVVPRAGGVGEQSLFLILHIAREISGKVEKNPVHFVVLHASLPSYLEGERKSHNNADITS